MPESLKQKAALAAIEHLSPDTVLGVGTGSTVNQFIDELASHKHWFEAVVASSDATEARLKEHGFPVVDLNTVSVDVYVDGTDEIDGAFHLVKGGGGALTREKIIASVAKQFIVIADVSKKVDYLGQRSPVPIEVLPMARSAVARALVKLGGDPVYREGFISDNGNVILDVYNLKLQDPITIDHQLNQVPGVVAHGLFIHQACDIALIASEQGIETLNRTQLSFDFIDS